MAKLTPDEQKEFNELKKDLLEYHTLGCKHYNPKKERYNELWDKNAKGVIDALKKFEQIAKQIDCN